jgi:carbon-monoxide dehydrogenase medium subunit
MVLPRFEYLTPGNLEEALSLLSKKKDKALIMAGGTALLIKLKMGWEKPEFIIGLKNIKELDYIEYDKKSGLRIGALTTFDSLLNYSAIRERFPFLFDFIKSFAVPHIRNMATLGGNICNAAPYADPVLPLIVAEAKLKTSGINGERVVPIDKFFSGPFKTNLYSDEILREIEVPNLPDESYGVSLRLSRVTSTDESLIALSILATLDGNVIKNIRIAMGSLSRTAIRAKNTEDFLVGKKVEENVIIEAANIISSESDPLTDREYRKEMAKVLLKRGLREIIEKNR